MERKFLVLLRRFRLQNELVLFYHFSLHCVAHFSVLAARRDASSSCLVMALNYVASFTGGVKEKGPEAEASRPDVTAYAVGCDSLASQRERYHAPQSAIPTPTH